MPLTLIEIAESCQVSLSFVKQAHDAGAIGAPVSGGRAAVRYSVADVNKFEQALRAHERREATAAVIAQRASKYFKPRPPTAPLPAGGPVAVVKSGTWGSGRR